MTFALNLAGFFFSTTGLIFILTATTFQSESWIPWAECSDQSVFIDASCCKATKSFLCLAVSFVWIGMMVDKIIVTVWLK